jgi:Ca2+-binding EF-hand superfamily protein
MNAICRINNKRFGKLIFQLFDNENKGEITFEEFLVTAFGALSLDDSSLAIFAFRLFDLDNSGHLTSNEVENLINVVCGSNAQSKAYIQMEMKKIDRKGDENYISVNQFLNMTEKSKLILYPAFEMRDMLRKNTLGIYRWRKLSRERKLKTGNKTIFEIFPLLQTVPTSLQNGMNYPMKQLQRRRNSNTGTMESIDRIKDEREGENNDRIVTEMEDLGRRGSRTSKKILPIENNEKEHNFFRGNASPVSVSSEFAPRRKSIPSVPLKNPSRKENIDIISQKENARRKSGSSVQLKYLDRIDNLSLLASPQKRKKSIDMTGYVRDLTNNKIDGLALTASPQKRRNSIDMTGSQYARDVKSRIDADAAKSRRRNSSVNIDTNISVPKNLTEIRSIDGYATASRKNSINIDLSDLNKKSPADSRRNSQMNIDLSSLNLNNKTSTVVRRNSSINFDLSVLNDKKKVDIDGYKDVWKKNNGISVDGSVPKSKNASRKNSDVSTFTD